MNNDDNKIMKRKFILPSLVVVGLIVILGSAFVYRNYYIADSLQSLSADASAGPCTGNSCISIDSSTIYQTIDGWEGTSQVGHRYVSPSAWNNVKTAVYDNLIEMGINRIRLEISSGAENPVDYYQQFIDGQITDSQWTPLSYEVVNDNNDPNSINASGFKWSYLDDEIDNIVLPLKQRLQDQGEQLYINVNFVDFKRSGNTGYQHKSNPAEYAEFVLATYQHMQSKYGFVPDSWEIILEPDTSTANWSVAQVGAAIKAAGDRLVAAGFTPKFVAPSTTNGKEILPVANGGNNWVGTLMGMSGVGQYIDTISYHRYTSPDQSQTQIIGNMTTQYGKKTAMLERIGADYNTLHLDLKYGNNSAWQQFTMAGPNSWGPDDGGRYLLVNDTAGTVAISSRAKFFRQYFKYIRRGAVRLGTTNSGNSSVDPVAFRNTDGKHVVVATVFGPTSFGINGLPAGTYGTFYTTSSNYNVHLPDQTIGSGDQVTVSMPGLGVVTVYAKAASSNPAPTISSFSASPATITAGGSTNLSWSVSGATSLSIDQGVGTVTGSSTSVSPTTTITYTLTATNSSGSDTAQATVTVNPAGDTTAPTVSLTAPANNATVSGSSTTVSASASDNVAVVGVQFKLDGANLGSEDTSSPYSITWDTTTASNGTHSITAVARDAAGNSTTSTARTVTVSNVTPPSTVATPSISPNGGSFSSSQQVSLSTSTSGATIRYTTDGSNPSSSTGTVYSSAFTVSATTTVKAIAYKSGSTDSSIASATFTITPATTGPAPVITSISVTAKTTNTVSLQWKTDISSTGSVSYGTSRNNLNLTAQETDSESCSSSSCTHTLTITGLSRNTNYRYRITATNNNASTSSIISSFKTSR